MKKTLTILIALGLSAAAFADDQVREAQQLLKTQGFYFGAVTGDMNNDTKGAIRRFQIRNGLEATSALDEQTINALRSGGDQQSTATPAQPPQPAGPATPETAAPETAPAPPPPHNDLLAPRNNPPQQPGEETAAPPAGAGDEMATLFHQTPYEHAPSQVQSQTVQRVQARLRKQGSYHGPVDGQPGDALRDALRQFQSDARLPETGRLDTPTLNVLHMLPGQKNSAFSIGGEHPLRGKKAR